MKAMIFAAGRGTRLGKIGEQTPKALLELNGLTLLERSLNVISQLGITDVVINIHHLAHQIVAFIEQNPPKGLNIIFSHEEEQLLDTGGGLKQASKYLSAEESILLMNVDVIANFSIKEMFNYHRKKNAVATLAVTRRNSSRELLFSENMELQAWRNNQTGETICYRKNPDFINPRAFSGIQIIEPEIFKYFDDTLVFPIIPFYLKIAQWLPIYGYEHMQEGWFDLGTTRKLEEAQKFIIQKEHEQ